MARQARVPLWQGKARIRRSQRIGSAKHGQSLDSHRDGMDRVRTARALLRVAMALFCKARHRHGKGSWGNALPRHSAALIATQNTAEDEHCVARLGQSIGWLGIGRASKRTA